MSGFVPARRICKLRGVEFFIVKSVHTEIKAWLCQAFFYRTAYWIALNAIGDMIDEKRSQASSAALNRAADYISLRTSPHKSQPTAAEEPLGHPQRLPPPRVLAQPPAAALNRAAVLNPTICKTHDCLLSSLSGATVSTCCSFSPGCSSISLRPSDPSR